jgi:hypothetical protein
VNTKALNELAALICRAQEQDRTPMGIAFAVDAAGRHMSPEAAAELESLRARVAELEDERHSTNEALDDAVKALRALERPSGPDALMRAFAPTKALRPEERAAGESDPGRRAAWRMLAGRSLEGEHYAAVHHDYRKGRDDLPGLGGQR